jgi:hypothetical protein
MTNKGLRIELCLVPFGDVPKQYLARLNCKVTNEGKSGPLAITLVHKCRDRYTRNIWNDMISTTPVSAHQRLERRGVIHVEQVEPPDIVLYREIRFWFKIHSSAQAQWGFTGKPFVTHYSAKIDGSILTLSSHIQSGSGFIYQSQGADVFVAKVSIFDGRPGAHLDTVFDPGSVALTERPFARKRIDRISKRLGGGISVSVALKPNGIKEHGEYVAYVVNITIDPKGGLQWPEE